MSDKILAPVPALGFVLLVALAARLYAFVGICRLDMLRYLEISNHVLNGGSLFDPQVFYASARLPLILPLIGSNALFGYGELVSVAWPLLCSLSAVAFTYFLARELFDPLTAFAAGLLMAIFPLEMELATQLLPDAIEGAFILGSVLFAVLAANRDERWRKWAILSGALMALAYYTRVNALVFLPGVLATVAVLKPSRWRRAGWILAGIALVLVIFALTFWAMSGDPFVDINKTREFYSSYQSGGFIERKDSFLQMLRGERAINWLVRLVPLALLAVIIKRDRAVVLLSIWVLGFFTYLEWISPLHGLDSSYRYIEPLVPPLLVLVACGSSALIGSGRRHWRAAAVGLLGLAVCFSMVRTGGRVADHWRSNARWTSLRQVAQRVAVDSDRRIYVDNNRFFYAVNYYSGFTLGRDTLEPPSAPVNEQARLFATYEEMPREWKPSWLVFGKSPVAEGQAELVETYPYPKRPLRLYKADNRVELKPPPR